MKKAVTKADFKEQLKQTILKICTDPKATNRDKNNAAATGAKLLAIEFKISGGEEGDFFD
jgi:hypothetical protein